MAMRFTEMMEEMKDEDADADSEEDLDDEDEDEDDDDEDDDDESDEEDSKPGYRSKALSTSRRGGRKKKSTSRKLWQ